MFDRHYFFIQLQTGFDLAVMQEQSLTLTLEEFVCQGLAFRMTPNAITVSSERCDCPMLTDRLFVSGFLCSGSNVQCHQADAPALPASL